MHKTLGEFDICDPGALGAHLKRPDPDTERLRSGRVVTGCFIYPAPLHDAKGFLTALFVWRR